MSSEHIKVATDAAVSALNSANLAQGTFADLASMFEAIFKLTNEHDLAHRIASIGKYLAEDWANMCDCQREELEGKVAALRIAQGDRS